MSEEGAIEKEDMFLKRIGGMVKLYAAVMQTGIAAGKVSQNDCYSVIPTCSVPNF